MPAALTNLTRIAPSEVESLLRRATAEWRVPVALDGPLPRPRKLTGTGKGAVAFFAAAAVAFGVLAAWAYRWTAAWTVDPPIAPGTAAAIALAPLAGLLLTPLEMRKQWMLLPTGTPTVGVIHHAWSGTIRGVTWAFIEYSFFNDRGWMITSRVRVSPNRLPALGTVITVLYDPTDPYRNRPWPFRFVRHDM